ncbi:GDSL-type esterase/lipase family protein [Mycoplasma enhydrae]|uniref:lipoprotein 17-related variable surface protein n=1 Tax=Mycoplasma enhydrae TaxID=2499220 RepID=UPI0021E7CF7D|nr:lipoprotein 17-related variable surface protein [Mycoplasma enhydrae]MCV3733454.1 GDSL-type esterase/lipase family protein [Mycoplasma enhydrae]
MLVKTVKKAKFVKILAASALMTPILPLMAISCINGTEKTKKKLSEDANKLKVIIVNKANKLPSTINDNDVTFDNDKNLKISIISKNANDAEGKLELKVKITSKSNEDISIEKTITIDGFQKKSDEPKTNKKLEFQKSDKLISKDEKVKYLAIGDSISAGFTAALDKDYPGQKNGNKLEGMSLPVYLAHYLNQDDSNRVESFSNLATSNSTIMEWLDLLDVQYESKKPDVFKKQDGIYQHTFDGNYTKFGGKDKFKEALINEIKAANLLTITLGANDFLRFFSSVLEAANFDQVLKELQKGSNVDVQKLIEFYTKFIELSQNEIQDRLVNLLNKITEINSNVNVVLFNYPAPFLRIISAIAENIPGGIKLPNGGSDALKLIMDPLTSSIKQSKEKVGKNIHFVDLFDAPYWEENQSLLSSIIFDIHPTVHGYKKMAMDAFIKLTASSVEEDTLKNLGWSKNYIEEPTSSGNKQIIELKAQNLDAFYKAQLGASKEDNIAKIKEEDEVFKNVKDKLKPNNISRRLESFPDKQIKEIFLSLLKKSTTLGIVKEYDPNSDILSFFTDNPTAADKLILWIKRSNYITKQLDKFQELIAENDWDKDGKPGAKKLRSEYLLKAIDQTFFKKENLLNLVKEFVSSDFATDFKAPLLDLITKLSKNILKNQNIKDLIKKSIESIPGAEDYVSKESQTILLNKIFSSDKLPEFIKSALNSFLDNGKINSADPEFLTIDSFDKLIRFLFKNQPKNGELQKAFSEIFRELLSDIETKQILVSSTKAYINKIDAIKPIFNTISDEETTKLINTFLEAFLSIENDFNLANIFANSMISELSSFNVDLAFKTFLEEFKNNTLSIFNDQTNIIKLVSLVRNNQNIKDNYELIKKLFNNTLDYLNQQSIITKEIEKSPLFKELLKSIDEKDQKAVTDWIKKTISEPSLRSIINSVLDLVFNTNVDLSSAKNVLDIVKIIAVSPQIDPVKNSITGFIKAMFNDAEAGLAKQLDILITTMWKNNPDKYNLEVIKSNPDTIKNFVDSFLKSVIQESTLFNTIVNNTFNQLKEINVDNEDIALELQNTLILGLIKFATTDEKPTEIYLPNVLSKHRNSLQTIFSKMDSNAYVKMINYIFEVSKFSLDGGIYSILFANRFKTLAQENIVDIQKNNYVARQTAQAKSQKLQITFNVGSGLDLLSLASVDSLLAAIYEPAVRAFFKEVSELIKTKGTQLDIKTIKKLSSYKAANRIYSSLALLAAGSGDLSQFWPNGGGFLSAYWTGLYPENFISKGMDKAYDKLLNTEADADVVAQIAKLDEANWSKLGIKKSGLKFVYDKHFFAGYSDKNEDTRHLDFRNFKKWTDDSILAFIANPEKTDNKYHNQKNIVLIAKLLQKGYLYKDMDKE